MPIESLQQALLSATKPVRYGVSRATFRLLADTGQLEALRDRYRGQTMLVVGNGPSLNDTPLDEFRDIPSIGMNKIDLIYPKTAWRPSIVVCSNSLVVRQHQNQFAEGEIPAFVAWKARSMVRRENRHRLAYFNLTASNAFSGDPIEGLGSSATVTYIALQMAYWCGARDVILFGVDHSFKYSGPKATYQKREGADVNHFDPNYFSAGSVWGTPDLDRSELDYGLAREAFEADGRRIHDATIGGKLEVFGKIDLPAARRIAGLGE